jgi:hypothetical protein
VSTGYSISGDGRNSRQASNESDVRDPAYAKATAWQAEVGGLDLKLSR